MGDIIALFPPEPRTCGSCINAAYSQSGIFCMLYREMIHNEEVAMECESYDSGIQVEVVPSQQESFWPLPVDDSHEYEKVELPEEMILRCEEYLKSLHTSGWGRPFSLVKDDAREAAEWLATQIYKFDKFLERTENVSAN